MASAGRLFWAARRASAMGPRELAVRVWRGVRNRSLRPRRPRPQHEIASIDRVASRPPDCLAEETGRLLRGAQDAALLKESLVSIGVSLERTVAEAEDIMEGRIPAFGWTHFELSYPPDWLDDPATGGRWPLDYWAGLDFRFKKGLDDPRYVWELNRQHELVTLARAYVLTSEVRYAEAVWASIRSWVEQNPPFHGINWTSALEVALRLISWAFAVDLVGLAGSRDGDEEVLALSVALQARHLHDNLSVYASSKNNHLIGEACGLLVAGAKFGFLDQAARWEATGRRILERELPLQVGCDGVSRELSVQYQSFVMEFGLTALAAGVSIGSPMSRRFHDVIGRMSFFLAAICGEAETPPSIGDEDGGRVYDLSGEQHRQALRAAACGEFVAGSGSLKAGDGSDLEPVVWMMGADVASRGSPDGQETGGRPRNLRSVAFPEGGYYVLERAGQHAVVDCGELGYLSIAAHGHADCLSVSMAVDGRWLLVDPGTYCYHRAREWRDHFRSTHAHNTVTLDGLDQSEMRGPFMWGRRARPQPRSWASSSLFDLFEGAHDGYVRSCGVTHRRTIVLTRGGGSIIIDRLEGSGEHHVSASFQLDTGVRISAGDRAESEDRDEGIVGDGEEHTADSGPIAWSADERLELSFADGAGLKLSAWLPEGLEYSVVAGSSEPRRGWVSHGFGKMDPAPQISFGGTLKLPATLVFAAAPLGSHGHVEIERERGLAEREIVIRFIDGDHVERCLFGESELAQESFSGTFGIEISGSGSVEASGFEIERWNRNGQPIVFTEIPNQLK